jgi:type I restriction enzyme S subunit
VTTANGWPNVPLGEILVKNEKMISLQADEQYREVTIRLWGKGVVLRRVVPGAEIAAQRRFRVSVDQFILSRIDARNGASGIVPLELNGAIVTNDFPSFETNRSRLLPGFLGWLSKTRGFLEMCQRASEGTTNRVRLKEERFLRLTIPLPTIKEQERILTKIDGVAAKISEVRSSMQQVDAKSHALLRSTFFEISSNASHLEMKDVAPLVRRKVEPRLGDEYPELGIRSFGKGTFHKPPLDYLSIGSKKLYRIQPGDVVFNNVFAWEGAVAVAQAQDEGRYGSHRFITCVPREGVITAEYLCFYFLTPEGLEQIGAASPGGAGRNRTLGLEKLAAIGVPVPSYELQLKFGQLLAKLRAAASSRIASKAKLDAFLPSVLDLAFRGTL